MGNTESSTDLLCCLLTSKEKRNDKQHKHTSLLPCFGPVHGYMITMSVCQTPSLATPVLRRLLFLNSQATSPPAKTPLFWSKHSQSLFLLLLAVPNPCCLLWNIRVRKVAHQSEERLDPASTELAVTSASAAGEPACTKMQYRVHPTSTCLHSFSVGGAKGLDPSLTGSQNV